MLPPLPWHSVQSATLDIIVLGTTATNHLSRYIQLQEEYIKDEQRFDSAPRSYKSLHPSCPQPELKADSSDSTPQEFEARTSTSSGGDQANPERTPRHRPVYGGHRSEVNQFPQFNHFLQSLLI